MTRSKREQFVKLIPASEELCRERYYVTHEDGSQETFPDLCKRIADYVGQNDEEKDNFFYLLNTLQVIPNTPLIVSAGTSTKGATGSACFVLPQVADSIDGENGWAESLHHSMLITKFGGGVGQDLSLIREKGATVDGHPSSAPGPIGYATMLDGMATPMRQNYSRRGAFMISLDINHPDAPSFAAVKDSSSKTNLSNMNLSFNTYDEFMYRATEQWDKVTGNKLYPLISPKTGKVVREINARDFLMEIATHAYNCGCPGMRFIDHITKTWCLQDYEPIVGVNPCGEQNGNAWMSCMLAADNLARILLPSLEFGHKKLDWKNFEYVIRNSVRFLDNVLDCGKFPTDIDGKMKFAEMSIKTRRIGLGVMGLAHLLILLELPYDSDEGRSLVEKIFEFKNNIEKDESLVLGRKKGTFTLWEKSTYYPDLPYRNSEWSTVAPTGATGVLANNETGGIEPIFTLAGERVTEEGNIISLLSPQLLKYCEYKGLDTKQVLSYVSKNGSIQDCPNFPEEGKAIFKIANEIHWRDHVDMQATIQKYVSNAISKTINLSSKATPKDVFDAYIYAWEKGCKGITAYVDGSKSGQPLKIAGQQHDDLQTQLVVDMVDIKGVPIEIVADILHMSIDEVIFRIKSNGHPLAKSTPIKVDPDHVRQIDKYTLQKIEGQLLAGGSLSRVEDEDTASLTICNYNINYLSSFDDSTLKTANVRKSRKIYARKSNDIETNILRTQEYPILFSKLYQRWYRDGTKRLPARFKITETSARTWFLAYGNVKNDVLYIYTSIPEADIERLIKTIEDEIVGTSCTHEDADSKGTKIIIGNKKAFFDYISRIPIETYKLDPENYDISVDRICPRCGSTDTVKTGTCFTCNTCMYGEGSCEVGK